MLSRVVQEFLSVVNLPNVIAWVGFWSVIGFLTMWQDKELAKDKEYRIGERTLLEIALIGGFVGIVLGGKTFHHKTRKEGFWGIVCIAFVPWAFLVYFIVFDTGALTHLGSLLRNSASYRG